MSKIAVHLNYWSYRWYIPCRNKQNKNGTAFARNEKVTRLFVQEWQCCLTLNKPQFAVLDLGQKWVTWELALNPAVKMQNAPVTWRATELCAVARLLLFTMALVFISFWNLQEQLNFFVTGDLVQCSKAHAGQIVYYQHIFCPLIVARTTSGLPSDLRLFIFLNSSWLSPTPHWH